MPPIYARVTITAINNLLSNPAISPSDAWDRALQHHSINTIKYCPKSAFLSLVEGNYIRNLPRQSIILTQSIFNKYATIQTRNLIIQHSLTTVRGMYISQVWSRVKHPNSTARNHEGILHVVYAIAQQGILQ